VYRNYIFATEVGAKLTKVIFMPRVLFRLLIKTWGEGVFKPPSP